MLGSIASYFFGGSANDASENHQLGSSQEAAPTAGSGLKVSSVSTNLSDCEEEWVVVMGGNERPALTLGSLNDMVAPPPASMTSSSTTITSTSTSNGARRFSSGTEDGEGTDPQMLVTTFSEALRMVAAPNLRVPGRKGVGSNGVVALTRGGGPRPPRASPTQQGSAAMSAINRATDLVTLKHSRSAQQNRMRDSTKGLKAKAMERANKAVTGGNRKNHRKPVPISIRAAGVNKQLKQC